MRYRAPLLTDGTLSNDHYRVLTTAQLSKFAHWSIQTGKPVLELMQGFVLEEIPWPFNEGKDIVNLIGELPNCGLYGCIDPDGTPHT